MSRPILSQLSVDIRTLLYPVATLGIFLLAWQAIVLAGPIPEEYLPGPAQALRALAEMIRSGDLLAAEWLTLSRTLYGAGLSAAIGLALAVAGANFTFLRQALQPLVAIFQVLPPAALVPISIYFLGFGERFFLFVICFAAIWPTYVVGSRALLDTDPLLLSTARLFGYSRPQSLLAIRLPAALPEIFTGLRLTAGLALIATVAAEMLASRNGLGFLLFDTAFSLHVDQTFAVLLVVAINGILVNGIVAVARRMLCGWRDRLEATIHA